MLVAPLDWGLGHATRCVPLITKLLSAGFKVIIGAEGDQKILLRAEFPDLEIVALKGYRLKYGSTKWITILKIIFQIPKILISINREKKWLHDFVKQNHLDMVIADNRFGLHHASLVSVFITHQLAIKTSLGKMVNLFVQRLNYRFINHFDFCWVPDIAGEQNLAGELGHPPLMPKASTHYIGWLSRMVKQDMPVVNKLLILLSGPEPQRSILEKILLAQITLYPGPVVLVRGLPSATEHIQSTVATVYNYLSGPRLQEIINQSDIIISRSGYSTIMDVLPLGKKCIFIPTPGQAEQEYLATNLTEKRYACSAAQDSFSLAEMISKIEEIQMPELIPVGHNALDAAIHALQQSLHARQR